MFGLRRNGFPIALFRRRRSSEDKDLDNWTPSPYAGSSKSGTSFDANIYADPDYVIKKKYG